jgi:IPT/TIG domain
VAVTVAVGALLVPATATARTITIGSPLTSSFPTSVTVLSTTTVTVAQTSLRDPDANASSPVDGVVRRWQLGPQAAADTYALRILRPTGTGSYTGVGTSSPIVASTTEFKTVPTSLPIRAGDVLGLEALKTTPTFRAVVPATGSNLAYWTEPDLADGATSSGAPLNGYEIPLTAQVEPAPRVTLVAPASGPLGGGTTVKIAGRDFSGATSVKFGSVPASSFVVDSELQITAVAPAAVNPGPVDISVTAAAGTSPAVSGDQFTYVAPTPTPSLLPPSPPTPCVVPTLVGKNLKVARKALAGGKCKLGKVTGVRGKRAKIVKQSPKPGTVRTAGSSVSVKLG